jgi:hypothetical protein
MYGKRSSCLQLGLNPVYMGESLKKMVKKIRQEAHPHVCGEKPS